MGAETPLPDGWRIERFDRFLTPVDRRVVIDDDVEYSTVGVRWYGNGAFVRDRLLGADIRRKQQWVIQSGDIVYNKLFAWKGSFAVADEAVDGHLVSDKFPTYALDTSQVEPEYLAFFFRTPQLARQAQDMSKGAAAISKLTLNPPQFWDLVMPLPQPPEQKRLIRLLRDAETKLDEARGLRDEANAAGRALSQAAIGQAMSRFMPSGTLADVLAEKPRNGWSARCDNADDGVPVLSLGAVTGFRYRKGEYKRTSEPTEPDAHYWLAPGDLLMTRSNTEQLVGHAAIYSGTPSPCIYPDLMMRLRLTSAVNSRFVHYWLQTPTVREIVQSAGRGTSSSMKKITQSHVMNLPFPTGLALDEQCSVVARLDELQHRIDELREAQAAADSDLELLMPSLLQRAFQGQL